MGEGVSAGAVCAKAGRAKADINATTAATVNNSVRFTAHLLSFTLNVTTRNESVKRNESVDTRGLCTLSCRELRCCGKPVGYKSIKRAGPKRLSSATSR